MTELFYRLSTDLTRTPVELEDSFSGPTASACWLIGGGPSLSTLPYQEISASPIPKVGINLSGTKLIRPNLWTSYDPSIRFHRSIYLDSGIMKFVHRRRATDLVPETSFKVCDCPNTYFFDRDGDRGFADFLSRDHLGIADWSDSFIQAVDILYRLGFRIIYLAGCEMRIRPSKQQIKRAKAIGVNYQPQEPLRDFLRNCTEAGLTEDELETLEPEAQYHFDERKSLKAAANTDYHYFRISQFLRMCRRSMSLAGLQLVSTTPHSRLNDYFPYQPARQILRQIQSSIGDPNQEQVRGLYQNKRDIQGRPLGPMKDFQPHNWKHHETPITLPFQPKNTEANQTKSNEILVEEEGFQLVEPTADSLMANERLQNELKELSKNPADLVEEG